LKELINFEICHWQKKILQKGRSKKGNLPW
jgi:hypothetical protein